MGGPLGTLTWTELDGRAPIVLVPVGSLEQHGPHLPVDTDTRIAVAVAERAALGRGDVVVAPPIAIGASGEHAGFPGTLSIGTEALRSVLVELGRSADRFGGVIFVNGHGGNHEAIRDAVQILTGEGRSVRSWSTSVPGGDAHAGRTETSLLLAIAPETVRLERAEPGATEPFGELVDRLRDEGVRSVSPNGVLGDPDGANAAEGSAMLGALVDSLTALLTAEN